MRRPKLQAAITAIQAQLGHRGPGRPKAAADGDGHSAPRRKDDERIRTKTNRRGSEEALGRVEESKPKRKLSAAGRRAIIGATKKRWAAIRTAKAKAARKPKAKAVKRRKPDVQETPAA